MSWTTWTPPPVPWGRRYAVNIYMSATCSEYLFWCLAYSARASLIVRSKQGADHSHSSISRRAGTDPCTTSGSALFRCSDNRHSSHTHRTGPLCFLCRCSIQLELSTCCRSTVRKHSHFQTPLENPSIQTHWVQLCCIKRLCNFGPKGAIQIRYYCCYSQTHTILTAIIIIIIIMRNFLKWPK